jgi:hypothetical protein
MKFACIAFCSLLVAPAVLAQDSDRPNLAGKWQIDPARSEGANGATLNIQTKDDDSLHYLLESHNGETAEFQCTTDGTECAMTDGGRKAKVSLWYNGASLVMMETKGNNVVKRKLTVTGSTLEMEVIPIVPQGKTDKLVFAKQS